MKKVIVGGLSESEARIMLLDYAKQVLMLQGGYKPKQLAVTHVAYSTGKALAMLRNRPVFNMNCGHYDMCVEWLRECGMPSYPTVATKRVRNKDTKQWQDVTYKTSYIQVFVNALRKYIHELDRLYEQGIRYDAK